MRNHIAAPAKSWLAALQFIAPAVPRRAPLPALAFVHLEPLTGHVMATDYETTAGATLEDWDSLGNAPFLVPYRALLRGIKLATKGDRSASVRLEAGHSSDGGQYVTMHAAGYKLTFGAPDVAEYPEIAPGPSVHAFDVEGRDLKAAIADVATAASVDDTLPILTGIRFSDDDGRITLLGTDRYRLAMSKVPALASPDPWKPFLIKAKTAADVARRVLATQRVGVHMSEDGQTVSFYVPGGVIRTQQIDGTYPDIEKLFPEHPHGAFDVERGPALAAARVALSMAESHTPVRLELAPTGLRMHFNEGLFDGSTSPLIKAEYSGADPESFTTALNPAYLIGALESVAGPTARINYTTAPKPVMITAATPEPDHKHLIMPVRLPQEYTR